MGQTPKNHFLVPSEVARPSDVFYIPHVYRIYFDMIALVRWQLSASNLDFYSHTQRHSTVDIRNCESDITMG